MRIFDPHAHMTSRTTDDYEAMYASGVRALVEPAFWLGQPRTAVGSFIDYFNSLLGWERFRSGQFGIRHHCTIGLNPKEANDEALAREVIDVLPRFLGKDGVVAIGEIGFDAMTAAEEWAMKAQLELAVEYELPVLVHTPHRDKAHGTLKTIEMVIASGVKPEFVVIDHNNELTVKDVLDSGCWAGFSIYPGTKMDEHRMVRVAPGARPRARARQLGLRLGRVRPAEGAQDRRPHGGGGLQRGRHRPPRVAQPGGVLRPERPAHPRRHRRARPDGDVRGQRRAAR